MGKLGRLSYPEIALDKSIEDARRIYKKFGPDEIADMNVIAGAIGLSKAKSGTFFYRMAALRAYGLIEGRGRIKVSELGKRISYPTNEYEELKAREEAVKNVKLFEAIYNKYQLDLPKENFWVDLANFTGAESPHAQKRERKIRRLYSDAVKYLKPLEKMKEAEMPPEKPEVAPPPTAPIAPTISGVPVDFAKFSSDDFAVAVRKDPEAIEFARKQINSWLDYVKDRIRVKEEKIVE